MSRTVLHIITGLERGGAEQALFRLVSSMTPDTGYRHAVVSMTPGGVFAEMIRGQGVPVTDLGMKRGLPSLKVMSSLRRLIQQYRPDIVQAWMYHANVFASVAHCLHVHRRPVIWNVRHSLDAYSDEKSSLRRVIRAGALLSRLPSAIIYNSRASLRKHEEMGYSRAKSVLVPNGFECDEFTDRDLSRAELRCALGIRESDIAVAHVARFHPIKDHATMLKAADRLCRMNPRLHFVLAGPGVTYENEALRDLVSEELRHRILLLGERADVATLFNASDVACLTSLSEGFPNVLGEAMAVGTPCVSTDVGDAAFIIGDTGRVVAPRAVGQLMEAIQSLAMEAASERSARSLKARARIAQCFSNNAMTARYQSVYDATILKESLALAADKTPVIQGMS